FLAVLLHFFVQAEDGIRDFHVTGVQTCALPIYTIGSPDGDLSFDTRDSAPFVPKCKILDPAFTWGEHQPVRVPWDRMIIYEAHLRGLSMRHPSVPEAKRGTFAGLTHPDLLNYLKKLGVTSIELLPVHAFVNDQHL